MRHLTVLPSDVDGHVEAELPWYVNGTLDAAERAHVDEHLASCELCCASFELEKRMAGILRAPRDTLDCAPQSGWTRLTSRLTESSPVRHTDAAPAPSASSHSGSEIEAPAHGRRRVSPLLAAVVLAQAATIGILSFLLLHLITARDPAPFRTLTQPGITATETATVRIVFAEEASAAQIGTLLRHVGGTITAGPSSAGVYTVELKSTAATNDPVAAADWLRSQTGVLFAEPVSVPASH